MDSNLRPNNRDGVHVRLKKLEERAQAAERELSGQTARVQELAAALHRLALALIPAEPVKESLLDRAKNYLRGQ